MSARGDVLVVKSDGDIRRHVGMDEVPARPECEDPFIERALTSPAYKEVLGPTIHEAARSYGIARVLSVVWFAAGVGLTVIAGLVGLAGGEGRLALFLGGLGIADMSAWFFYRPIERIQSGVDQLISSQIACVSYVAQYDSVVRVLVGIGKQPLDATDREEQLRQAAYLRDSTSQLMADLRGRGSRIADVAPEARRSPQGQGAAALEDQASLVERAGRKLEEYGVFIEDTARYSDRRQTASNIYVAVNALLLAAAAVVVTEGNLEAAAQLQDWRALAVVALLIAGFCACVVWLKLICTYEQVIGKRVAELREIEKEIPDSHRMYRRMGKVPSFSKLERVLPVVFMVLYAVLCWVFLLPLWNVVGTS
jgi:hypothetical protein